MDGNSRITCGRPWWTLRKRNSRHWTWSLIEINRYSALDNEKRREYKVVSMYKDGLSGLCGMRSAKLRLRVIHGTAIDCFTWKWPWRESRQQFSCCHSRKIQSPCDTRRYLITGVVPCAASLSNFCFEPIGIAESLTRKFGSRSRKSSTSFVNSDDVPPRKLPTKGQRSPLLC